MTAPRNETFVRTTDIVADVVASRLGNTGTDDLKDLVNRINTALRVPVEVRAQTPASTTLQVGAGIITLPDGTREALLRDGVTPSLAIGTIALAAGTISTGSNGSFTPPTMIAGNYVRALVQYRPDSNALDVTFGTQAISLAASGVPALKAGYDPVAIVELHSTSGGVGDFDVVSQNDLIWLHARSSNGPYSQTFTVVAPQTVFNLTVFAVPANRKRLRAVVNGVGMVEGDDYTVTSDTQVTFAEAQPANAVVTFTLA